MSALVVVKGDDGRLQGFGEKGARAWAKFRARVDGMAIGETLSFQWREPRSQKHHAFFFGKLAALLERQEQFEDVDKLRAWLVVGAGYCDFVPGPNGRMVALPQSINWVNLDEADFADLHGKVDAFLWTEHARKFLWGHLSNEQSYELIDQLQKEFS